MTLDQRKKLAKQAEEIERQRHFDIVIQIGPPSLVLRSPPTSDLPLGIDYLPVPNRSTS